MKKNYKNEISSLIKEINKDYPNIPFGTHLALALSEYTNIESLTDKEFVYILNKYKLERELDISIPHDLNPETVIEAYMEDDSFEEDEF